MELLQTLVMLACAVDIDSGDRIGDLTPQPLAQEHLGDLCKDIVSSYGAREDALAKGRAQGLSREAVDRLEEEVLVMMPVVNRALKAIIYMGDDQLKKNSYWVYFSLVSLIKSESSEVRDKVHAIFATRMSTLVYGQQQQHLTQQQQRDRDSSTSPAPS
ncbi:unnamed protein product [Chrysoparadoxa australica]